MRTFWRAPSVALLLVGMCAARLGAESPAGSWADDIPLLPEKVRQHMQGRDYLQAVQAIEEAARSQEAPGEYLAYLRGWALYLAGQHDAAIAALAQFEKDFPRSGWLRRVRYAKALALARKGDFRSAELIYRREAEYVLSAERRQQLAAIYLEFADAAFKPAKEDQKPDYKKALEIYRQALEVGPPPERRLEVELLVAQCHQALSSWPEAARLYAQFTKDHPQSPWDIEARFRLGQCQLASGARAEARRTWQDLLAKYADSPSPRIPEAAFRLAETWRIPKPATAEELSLGVAALESYLQRFPSHPRAGEAHLRIAQSYLHRGRHEEAAAALVRFVKDPRWHDRHELPVAWNLLGQTYRAQGKLREALATWREFLTRFPTHEAWTSAQKEIVTTEYLIGMEHYQAKRYDAALQSLAEFVAKYPLDERHAAILLLFGQIRSEQKQWEAAIAEWLRLVAKYPDTEEASRARLQIAQTLEQPLARLEEALAAYRQVTGSRAEEARRSIDRLTRAAMTVSTERVFRSGETPRVSLITRNIESVAVRVYKIDLETYFRKMHSLEGIDQLDIAIIDPDRVFEFRVPGYVKYRQMESTIEVPLPQGLRAGAMAVTVSSQALEATAIVIQSDLDIILKGARDEVFVFAENMLTGKPWPGVRLLVSDGQQIMAETVTGQQGVARVAPARLRQSAEAKVFACCDGHVACSESVLRGATAQEPVERGYLYTDMPVYRPGGRVHVRGCVRRPAADAPAADEEKSYTLEAWDSRGRPVARVPVRLSGFGSFHAAFDLPRTSPIGEYRLAARNEQGRSYQGRFRVQEGVQQLVQLTIEAPRRVYYRGEVIEGTIRAAWYHGAAIAGREIRYGWPLAPTRIAKTDARGEVHFQLPTRELEESQTLPFTASLPEHNVQAAANFFLSTLGFRIEVRSPRSVYIAGEPLEVTVATRDAEGRPTAQKLTLRVLRQAAAPGKSAERLAEEHAMETGTDGIARRTLTLSQGGRYVLRAEGTDRFQNTIAGETRIEVSDEEDADRLRILADRQTYQAGDTAEVTVHWREEPALALVTFERSRVLDWRLVTLQRGATKLTLPMSSLLAPHCNLSVAVMHDRRQPPVAAQPAKANPPRRFHVAECLFAVERELKVALSCQRTGGAPGAVRPGEPVEVTVRTTDPQGKPAIAEVSLALLPRALADATHPPAGSLKTFFRGPLRDPSVSTSSSIAFACRPATRPISRRLVSELDRAKTAQDEAARRDAVPRNEDPFGDARSPRETAGGGRPAAAPAAPPSQAATNAAARGSGGRQAGPSLDGETSAAPAATIRQSQAAGLLGGLPAEAAYWNPAIVTAPDGKATVRFTLPDQAAAWTLVAQALTADGLVGEAVEQLAAGKPFCGELKLPGTFTDGDEADVPVIITNDLFDQGAIEVALTTELGGRVTQDKKTLHVKARGVVETSFRVPLRWPEGSPAGADQRRVVFELAVAGGGVTETVRRTVPLAPYGMPVLAATGGSAETDTTAWIETAEGIPFEDPRLQIVVGPTAERSLLDVLVGPPAGLPDAAGGFLSAVDTATSDLMAALGLQMLLGVSRDAGGPQAQELDARARAALATLMLAQNDDGGWSWSGQGGSSDRYTTARVVWAVSLARKEGYLVAEDAFEKAVEYLAREAAALEAGDLESRAMVLHALMSAGRGDFTVANHLHRERASLSPAALAYLALALIGMDRRSMAEEALALLARGKWDRSAPPRAAERGCSPWSGAESELRALYALAAQELMPKAPQTREQIDWLLAHRPAHRWLPDKATGPAMLALCRWFAKSRFQGARYRLAVLVNDKALATLDVDPAAGTRVLDVPPGLLVQEKQKIVFQLTGRGRYAYQCILRGHVPAGSLKSTTAQWQVTRTFEPAPREHQGRELPRGFGIVQGQAAAFRNPLRQLPVGGRGLVELAVRRAGSVPAAAAERQLEYLVVTEPIAAGTAVIQSSIRGGFDRYEIVSGAIVFYLGKRPVVEPIRYELHGYVPGTYRVPPTLVRDAFRPQDLAVAAPAELTVLPPGATPADPYRLSPEELYELGKRHMEAGDLKSAGPYLTELVEKWNLQPEIHKDVVGRLLDVHLHEGPPEKVVRYFETIVEKWPEQIIPLEKTLKVGAAYHDIGEFERSQLVFRAAVEGSFARETRLGEFLDAQGEFLRSMAFLNRLVREYPPEGYVAEAVCSLAHQLANKAPQAAQDPQLRARKVDRVGLLRRAWETFENFLTAWPEDPAADQAAFSAASALLQLKEYRAAAAACERYAARYPDSSLLDHFLYMAGYCRFAAGQHKEAIDICRRLADSQRVDKKTGRPVESPNKHRAIFILGQIYHSLGQVAEAVREYRRVADRFTDARLSIEYFLRQAIELPELASFKPGTPVELELKFRNLTACDVKVYRIDLMKFTLLKGDLAGIARINLAGVRPLHEAAVQLGDGQDYRDRAHKLPLPLAQQGAYLVVARGGDLHASGLVLVTPLEVEVQTDPGSGQARAMVKDTVTGRYLSGVAVKVIGSRMSDFVSGETDLRGVFVAEGIQGAPTVIADAGSGRYAFFRSLPPPGAAPLPPPSIAGHAEPSGRESEPAAAKPEDQPPAQAAKRRPAKPASPGAAPAAERIASAPVDMGGGGPAESERRIREALASPTHVRCVQTPLREVVEALKDQHKIEIQLDTKALADVGVSSDAAITRTLEGLTLRSALDLILRDLDLAYAIRDEVLLITTQERAEAMLTTVVYPVGDLVAVDPPPGELDRAYCDFDRLIQTICLTVSPDTWDEVGGPGHIDAEPHSLTLVVSQTENVHDQIASLLARLRQAAGKPADGSLEGLRVTCVSPPQAPAGAKRIESVLDSATRLDFAGTPLRDAVERLKSQHQIEVQLDTKALADIGCDAETPITRSLHGVTLRSALDLLLSELDLTYVIQDEMLLVTSREQAEAHLATVIHPVGDLIEYRDSSGVVYEDAETLINLIQTTVAPDGWDAVGGPGSVEYFPNSRSLVISQTSEVQSQVAGLLETLRQAGAKAVPSGEPPLWSGSVLSMPEGAAPAPGMFMGLGGFPGAAATEPGSAAGAGGAAKASRGRRPTQPMGAGMGGLGGWAEQPQPPAAARAAAAAAASEPANELVEGIDEVTRQLQSKWAEKGKSRPQPGAPAEKAERGMGGFGGGVGAGGFF